MRKKTWILVACVVGLFLLVLCVLIGTHVICIFHEMRPATCTEPQTCTYCGHTEGTALGHAWMNATCEVPQTCSICQETTGNSLEHVAGDWVYGDIRILGTDCTRTGYRYCTLCKERLEEKDEILDILHKDGAFMLSPADFTLRMDTILGRILDGNLNTALSTTDEGYVTCVVSNGSEEIATIYFMSPQSAEYVNETLRYSENVFGGVICDFSATDAHSVFATLWGITMCFDPQLAFEGALELDFLSGPFTHNGMTYRLTVLSNDNLVFFASIVQ